MNRHGTADLTTPSDTEILITRRFDAPASIVFSVWTTVDHVRRWWSPPEHPMTVCEIDLTVGGSWRWVFGLEEGVEVGFHGTYQEIDPPHRLVYTESFEGMPGDAVPATPTTNTLTLTEDGGVTTMTLRTECPSKDVRDMILATGMLEGFELCLNRIEDLAAGTVTAAP